MIEGDEPEIAGTNSCIWSRTAEGSSTPTICWTPGGGRGESSRRAGTLRVRVRVGPQRLAARFSRTPSFESGGTTGDLRRRTAASHGCWWRWANSKKPVWCSNVWSRSIRTTRATRELREEWDELNQGGRRRAGSCNCSWPPSLLHPATNRDKTARNQGPTRDCVTPCRSPQFSARTAAFPQPTVKIARRQGLPCPIESIRGVYPRSPVTIGGVFFGVVLALLQ